MADERDFPDVEFVETDTETLVSEALTEYEAQFGRTLYPADPEKLRMLWYLAITSQTRSMINIAAKRNLPRYAEGEYLDSLAELFYGVERLAATPATVDLTFTLSEAQEFDITVPEGTEVTTESGEIVFATTEELVIAAGETTGTVTAECTEDGTVGNDYAAGMLGTIIDPIAYVSKVTNAEASGSGTDEEDDSSLYARMKESLEAYSTAGTVGAYKYHAMSYNSEIEDVVVTTPSAGCVDVAILLEGGVIPDESTLEEMQEYLRSDEIRPLTDYVTVSAPTAVDFSVDITWYTEADSTESQETIQAAVEAAVESYITWQTRKMGRRINPSKLVALVIEAGAGAVDVTQPVATAVGECAVGQCNGTAISYGGTDA
ncbi:MAG: baseplate J/gp47 family protein [Clostridiales bacterium]|nr:baseplate J/gp47 family protein [Clostridiales bacterium]